MPQIFDNINEKLLEELSKNLERAKWADFCVGYFNLRGWRLIDRQIEKFKGKPGECCRLLVGMQKLPKEELNSLLAFKKEDRIDTGTAKRIEKRMAQEFRQQLLIGSPNNEDEAGLKRLREQLLSKKLVVKLYLKHTLHAKLYIVEVDTPSMPSIAFLGSSNLTFSGLSGQGELNVDVGDRDATKKLRQWFDDRWKDRFCFDISDELAEIIDESWASEKLTLPYHVYLKMAYHLSQEARDGLSQYQVPPGFELFEFQAAAVRIAAHHVNRRGGVIVGDVVGLGKTIVGTAIAKICEEDFGISTLIICPKNLIKMWKDYAEKYGLRAKVVSISRVDKELQDIPARFRLVLIDESHNLRNREGKRYEAIKEYIEQSNSRCILLTATPYNKTYLDLSAQLRLFIPEDRDLGIKPEALIRELGNETEFTRIHSQTSVRSLSAFEQSQYSEDWQQLMSRYMVRRTRSFIKDNYAQIDPENTRKFLEFPDGRRSYFPTRIPKTAQFNIGEVENDPYARLYSDQVVNIINSLELPRYGLGIYEQKTHNNSLSPVEKKQLDDLSRSGWRLMGFCRTNLFKRLESSGIAFIQSLERHILRNYVYIYAIKEGLDIPIGTQDAEFLDTYNNDEDSDSVKALSLDIEAQENQEDEDEAILFSGMKQKEAMYEQRAADVYKTYTKKYKRRFKWLRSDLFSSNLKQHLRQDSLALIGILQLCGEWKTQDDQKLQSLIKLLEKTHNDEKVLIFTQFADTARYLGEALKKQGIGKLETVTGNSHDPTAIAYRFSPVSNGKNVAPDREVRVLVTTDVLSEGQNLQDCRIIVNYDLPWAIIRLIQRAGRIDRIGQKAETILCYSFLPADGVEQLINLRGRLRLRLTEYASVVGTDEQFFEEGDDQIIVDLYHEKAGILDEDEDNEVDLTSEALQIWNNAIDADPDLADKISRMPNVAYATREHNPQDSPTENSPEGVLMYLRTSDGTDALAWFDRNGKSVTQSQSRILRMARCNRDTPAKPRHPQHHELVEKGAKTIIDQQKGSGGQLGSPRSARAKTYERLKHYMKKVEDETPLLATGLDWENLSKASEEIHQYPLRETAVTRLNRQFKSGISDEQLAEMVRSMRDDDLLCVIHPEDEQRDAHIICSMGLFKGE